jgi:hypothetical protein
MANDAKWRYHDEFPSSQLLANELEKLLVFADEIRCFEAFLPRLRDNARARNAALGELLTAFYLHKRGFENITRDPPGANFKIGEWSATFSNSPAIFIEVKSPDWQAELSDAERLAGRKTLGKHVDLEARFVAPFDVLMDVILRNAVPKLLDDSPNLIITADDMFVSIVGMPHLEMRFSEWFAKPDFSKVGGIMSFRTNYSLDPDRVLIRFEVNHSANVSNRLPPAVIAHLNAQAFVDSERLKSRDKGTFHPEMF